jgi:prolyl oligopeptidase
LAQSYLLLVTLLLTLKQAAPAPELTTLPFSHGNLIFYGMKIGSGPASFYVQAGLRGRPRKLLDPTEIPSLNAYMPEDFYVSKNGRYVAYAVDQAEKPFQEIHVYDLNAGKPLPDVLRWTRVTDMAWRGDGFYYAKFVNEGRTDFKTANLNHAVFFHHLRSPQSEDRQEYLDPTHPTRFYTFLGSFDEKMLFLRFNDRSGSHKGDAMFLRHEDDADKTFRPIRAEAGNGRLFLCDTVKGGILFETTIDAPRGKVVLIDPKNPSESHWKTIVPEGPSQLESADTNGGRLFLTYKESDGDRVLVCTLDGKVENTIQGLGQVEVQWGRRENRFVFMSAQLGASPKIYYRYLISDRKLVPFLPPQTAP